MHFFFGWEGGGGLFVIVLIGATWKKIINGDLFEVFLFMKKNNKKIFGKNQTMNKNINSFNSRVCYISKVPSLCTPTLGTWYLVWLLSGWRASHMKTTSQPCWGLPLCLKSPWASHFVKTNMKWRLVTWHAISVICRSY